jgi:hypothetical protein
MIKCFNQIGWLIEGVLNASIAEVAEAGDHVTSMTYEGVRTASLYRKEVKLKLYFTEIEDFLFEKYTKRF